MTATVDTAILLPAVVLILWSLVMLIWMATTRLPAAVRIGVHIGKSVGGRGPDLDPQLPPKVAWKSHNYAHLMEQPTIFYPTVIILAVMGAGDGAGTLFAWGYVAFRIAHSLWQVTVNVVRFRFLLFLGATICLVCLALTAFFALLRIGF